MPFFLQPILYCEGLEYPISHTQTAEQIFVCTDISVGTAHSTRYLRRQVRREDDRRLYGTSRSDNFLPDKVRSRTTLKTWTTWVQSRIPDY